MAGLLPVEQFMREYFRHTNQVSHVVEQFWPRPPARERLTWLFDAAVRPSRGRRAVRVGPAGITATRRGLQKLRGNLAEIVRLADLANLYDVPIAPATWEFIRREAPRLPASRRRRPAGFSSPCWRIPAGWARCCATCTRPPSWNASFPSSPTPAACCNSTSITSTRSTSTACGRSSSPTRWPATRGRWGASTAASPTSDVLHLALLIHDLGKGFLEDHREIGLKIAERGGPAAGPARRRRPSALKFLVHKHLRMNHLAFRRDTSDEEIVVRFAVQVGSPEAAANALRAHGRRPRRRGPGRVGRLEGRNPHRPLPPHDAATGRRKPRHHAR